MVEFPKESFGHNFPLDVPQPTDSDGPAPQNNDDYRAAQQKTNGGAPERYLPDAPTLTGLTQQKSVDVDGEKRDYSVHVPANWDQGWWASSPIAKAPID